MQAGLQGNGHRNLMCKDLYAALTCALDTGSRLGTIRNEAQPRELCTTTQSTDVVADALFSPALECI